MRDGSRKNNFVVYIVLIAIIIMALFSACTTPQDATATDIENDRVDIDTVIETSRDVTVTVTRHFWERSISIQEYDEFTTNSWRDSRPAEDSVSIVSGSCRQEQRSTSRVADGESCETVRHDNGDGTFSARQECTTNYREEPVYDDMCTWEGFRWENDRTEQTSGGLEGTPYWADIDLNCEGESRVGCERESGRNERYTVFYEETSGNDEYRCDYSQEEWSAIPLEFVWFGQVLILDPGSLLCDTLQRQ